MNAPILRVYGVIVILFALLIVFTSRWTVLDASSLQNNTLNKQVIFADRGIIYDRNRKELVWNITD